MSSAPKSAAIIGGGVIGGGWAARFLLNGWNVRVFDPDPEASRKISTVLDNARRSLPALYDRLLPPEGRISYHEALSDALDGVDWIQESVPERLDIKHEIHANINTHAPEVAIIASSTSGFKPSELNTNGQRIIVAHPFNPVYLLPLVELVGDPDHCARASMVLNALGMYPLMVRKEIDAHIADRLLEAVWREGLWLIKDGICTTKELDDAICMGFGLRWAQMGLFETYRIAGGEAGMRHFLAQFGPALKWPWTKLMDVPEFTESLVDLISDQSDAQSGHLSIRQLEHLRDDNLVGMMRSLKKSQSGAGATLSTHEQTLKLPKSHDLPITVSRAIPQSWTDYNGHMNEAHFLEAASLATDQFMEMIGAGPDYVAAGYSYFTVENHIRYLTELHSGDRIFITTQVLQGKGRKLHLFHSIIGPNGDIAATVETLLVHMNLTTRKSALPSAEIEEKLKSIANAHAAYPMPDGAGRHVGQARTA
ncbi:L-carnitine dehydrogenase [Amylibacter marinus]|uniref:L-carnitine dehydrogenase n=1 Tax=Amylibacter marinus TaxID=1475483 RepID=A0ABQ5VXE5_9RHOB|nr:carnitine 3-dehydrogenase [Amylibacter marinus]GLQ36110.1 L-carnitine dehydrogenase [Amylibacter marinus]